MNNDKLESVAVKVGDTVSNHLIGLMLPPGMNTIHAITNSVQPLTSTFTLQGLEKGDFEDSKKKLLNKITSIESTIEAINLKNDMDDSIKMLNVLNSKFGRPVLGMINKESKILDSYKEKGLTARKVRDYSMFLNTKAKREVNDRINILKKTAPKLLTESSMQENPALEYNMVMDKNTLDHNSNYNNDFVNIISESSGGDNLQDSVKELYGDVKHVVDSLTESDKRYITCDSEYIDNDVIFRNVSYCDATHEPNGFIDIVKPSGKEYGCINIATHPDYRRQGIGKELIDNIPSNDELGISDLYYEVERNNISSCRFIASLTNFHQTNSLSNDYLAFVREKTPVCEGAYVNPRKVKHDDGHVTIEFVKGEKPYGEDRLLKAISETTYLLADVHIGDPTDSPVEAKKKMIMIQGTINDTVPEDGHLLFLGDLSGHGLNVTKDMVRDFVSGIHCRNLYLILGNDDYYDIHDYEAMGFLAVTNRIQKGNLIFTHTPEKDIPNGCLNIHAHLHGAGTYWGVEPENHVDIWNSEYKPITVDEAVDMYASGKYRGVAESVEPIMEISSNSDKVPIFASVFHYNGTGFSSAVRVVTRSMYNHATLAFTPSLNPMYTFSRHIRGAEGYTNVNGFATESLNDILSTDKDAEMKVMCAFIPKEYYRQLKSKIKQYVDKSENTSYDFINLARVVFGIPMNINKLDNSMICSEFVAKMFHDGGVELSNKPVNLVTPEDIATSKNVFCVYMGKVSNYSMKKVKEKLSSYMNGKSPLLEAKRSDLEDSEFGVSSKRKYPLDSKKHVLSAIKLFNWVDKEDEKELASKINAKIIEYKIKPSEIHITEKNRFLKYMTSSVSEAYSLVLEAPNKITADEDVDDLTDEVDEPVGDEDLDEINADSEDLTGEVIDEDNPEETPEDTETETDDMGEEDLQEETPEEDTTEETGEGEEAPDLTEDVGGEGDDEDTGDTTDDTAMDDMGDDMTSQDDNTADNSNVKNYNLILKFQKLNVTISEIIDGLDDVTYPSSIQNQVLEQGINDLKKIKSSIINYIEFGFSTDYTANQYYYLTFMRAMSLVLQMLNKNCELADKQENKYLKNNKGVK